MLSLNFLYSCVFLQNFTPGQWETNTIWLFMLCDTTASSMFAENINERDQQNFMALLYNCEINKSIVF